MEPSAALRIGRDLKVRGERFRGGEFFFFWRYDRDSSSRSNDVPITTKSSESESIADWGTGPLTHSHTPPRVKTRAANRLPRAGNSANVEVN